MAKTKTKIIPTGKNNTTKRTKGDYFPFFVICSGTKLGVHNWSHGIKEKSNHYLSPENAVKALAAKLVDYADPNRPKGTQDVIAIMVTNSNIDQFIADLENVRDCYQNRHLNRRWIMRNPVKTYRKQK